MTLNNTKKINLIDYFYFRKKYEVALKKRCKILHDTIVAVLKLKRRIEI